MKERILQSHTSIPLKCWTSCLLIKLKLGRVGFGPSCPAPEPWLLTDHISTNILSVWLKYIVNWASSRENLSSEVCEQQRRRPACASAQSDQRLCYSRFGKNHILACYKRNFNFLASLCSFGDWFECGFVRNPEDRFSHDEAQLMSVGHITYRGKDKEA